MEEFRNTEIEKCIKNTDLYRPSDSFTSNVMTAIFQEKKAIEEKKTNFLWLYLVGLFVSPFFILTIIGFLLPNFSFLSLLNEIINSYTGIFENISFSALIDMRFLSSLILLIKLMIPAGLLLGIEHFFFRNIKGKTLLF